MPWTRGISGNPKGRPRKDRALAAILAARGHWRKPGERHTAAEHAADLLWEFLSTGELHLADRVIQGSAQEWLKAYAYVTTHLDGPFFPDADDRPAGDVLDQVLAELDRPTATASAALIQAQLGLLVLACMSADNPDLLARCQELRQALAQDRPDVVQLVQLRRWFASRPGHVGLAGRTFFDGPEMQALMKGAVDRE